MVHYTNPVITTAPQCPILLTLRMLLSPSEQMEFLEPRPCDASADGGLLHVWSLSMHFSSVSPKTRPLWRVLPETSQMDWIYYVLKKKSHLNKKKSDERLLYTHWSPSILMNRKSLWSMLSSSSAVEPFVSAVYCSPCSLFRTNLFKDEKFILESEILIGEE